MSEVSNREVWGRVIKDTAIKTGRNIEDVARGVLGSFFIPTGFRRIMEDDPKLSEERSDNRFAVGVLSTLAFGIGLSSLYLSTRGETDYPQIGP